ncbi:MAG: PQQ-like beta-propeller repeat protein [Planctomycetaceae bacterium]|jgi:outer membrane protein assembly factor BamB|nr:PQQ-like beta-propeller repeat protein [Planctomycetaceae bacterium]
MPKLTMLRPESIFPAWPTLAILALVASTTLAGDWPQILGPHRNGIATAERLADSWPNDGPKLVWQKPVGTGFSGPAVAGGRVFLFDRTGVRERVTALSASDGRQLWKSDFAAKFVPAYVKDDGPRCVPIVHDGRVIVFGAQGGLHCLDAKTGKTHWSRNTMADFNSKRPFRGEPPEGFFGKGSTPIVVGNLVIVNVGGAEKMAGIVAFRLADGKTAWQSTDVRASYSSPAFARIGTIPQVIFAARFHVVSVDPRTGKELFRFPFGRPGPNVTAANPLVIGERIFVTASYGFGAVMATVSGGRVRDAWRSDEILSSQYTTAIASGGRLYGIHGRQDSGQTSLRCIDAKDGRVAWEEPGFGYATLIAADGKLLMLKTDGTLVLARLSPDKYQPLAKAQIFTATTRALPALASGRLYARDGQTLKSVHVGRASK